MTRAAAIAGLGAYVPPIVLTNDLLAAELDTSDEWIRSRTGVVTRHVVPPGTGTGDLAVEAGRRALKSAGVDGVDLVIVATATPDRSCPATAPGVAARLDLAGVAAFDLGAVCAGFVYGLVTASSLITAGVADSALLIGADTFSRIMDPADRGTRVIFGDGAGAVVLRAAEPGSDGVLAGVDLGSDGRGDDLITVPAGGYFQMAGARVFAEAVRRMAGSAAKAAERAGWSVPDIDLVVPHQANSRIIETCADHLGIPRDRTVDAIATVGNTVAASIPIALADAAVAGRLRAGHRVVLTSFGGGLAWAAAALRWPDISPQYQKGEL